MPRFFVEAALEPDTTISLPLDLVRHVHVLRLEPGAHITLFNGQGGEFDAQLLEIDKKHALARLGAETRPEREPPYRITLAQGIAGGDKMDWLIEKAVELGVHRIVPLTTAKSVVRLSGERSARRHAHWQALARAACEQCGRNRVPAIEPPAEFGAFVERQALAHAAAGATAGALRWLLSPRASQGFATLPEHAPAEPITLLIGPEGGLSDAEEDLALQHGFTALGLGTRILRCETAGMAVLAALAGRWGGW